MFSFTFNAFLHLQCFPSLSMFSFTLQLFFTAMLPVWECACKIWRSPWSFQEALVAAKTPSRFWRFKEALGAPKEVTWALKKTLELWRYTDPPNFQGTKEAQSFNEDLKASKKPLQLPSVKEALKAVKKPSKLPRSPNEALKLQRGPWIVCR